MASSEPAAVTDVLGEPYTAERIELPEDDEGAVEATLVRRPADGPVTRGAVLHVHGFADYFFQTEYAEWWAARGHDFYAVDLRKYGRSMRPHHTPNYVTDLREHFAELDEAWSRVVGRDGHRRVVLSAHSTGGLVMSLWAHHRQHAEVAGAVLNAPWLDLHASLLMRTVGTAVLDRVGAHLPRRVVPRRSTGLYARTLHRDHDGEWEFDLEWKPLMSWPVYAGWLRAVRRGHAELHRGLDLRFPVLVLSSATSSSPLEMSEDAHSSDIVLDVDQIRRWAPQLGSHVTIVAVPGARHDVVLSRPAVRAQVYAELDRWAEAYLGG